MPDSTSLADNYSSPPPGTVAPPHIGTPRVPRVFVTAAEVSGDRHAAQFIRSLRAARPDAVVEGFGGPEMAAAGATIHRETVTNAAMGFRGALRAVEVYRALRWARDWFDAPATRPDLWVGVDSPSMNFHFARAAHDRGIPTLQFVAPQLWAWAPWRMKKLRRWVDRVACVLPFEEAYFRGHGVDATFVGHPLFDELPPRRERPPGPRFPDAPPVVGLLPGSRRGIAELNFPRQLLVARALLSEFPAARFVVPTTDATDPVVRRHVAAAAAASGPPADRVAVEPGAFDRVVPGCDLCLTVSGTATLHVATHGVPMVVVYAGSPALWHLLGRRVIRTRTFAMVNLLADPTPLVPDPEHRRHLVPEIVPWHGSTAAVAELAAGYLRHPDRLADQRARLADLVGRLDQPGASDQVARMAMEMMGRRPAGARHGGLPSAIPGTA